MAEEKDNNFLDIPQITEEKNEIFSLFSMGIERGASDIILSVGCHPVLRIDGKLFSVIEKPKLTAGYISSLFDLILTPAQKETLQKDKELDFSYIYKDQAFLRINLFFQKGSLGGVARVIPAKVRTFDELGLPPTIKKFAKETYGLVLLSGISGSGKSTTIAAILEEINRTRAEHILTIEDPIEYIFKPRQSVINQRELRRDTLSFKNALRSALRENFNVIFIGGMRDLESMESALEIAEAGHLVFATVHSNSAYFTPDRIINSFPPYYQAQVKNQLANVLIGIVAQKLLPKADGGRVPVLEILMANQAVRNIIREGKTQQLKAIMETSHDEGMITFEQAVEELVAKGLVIPEVAKKNRWIGENSHCLLVAKQLGYN